MPGNIFASYLFQTYFNARCPLTLKAKQWRGKIYYFFAAYPLTSRAFLKVCIEINSKSNFYCHPSLSCLKMFYEGVKDFIKLFEAPQRSVKMKI